MEPWKPTDIIAIASLVGGIFGKGGGNELHSALTMEAMVERMGEKAGPQGLGRLPLEERPGSADDDRQAVPVRDAKRLRQARPGAAGTEERLRNADRRGSSARRSGSDRPEHGRRPPHPRARRSRARLELGARLHEALGRRPPDRGDGPAGRLLRAADPDGGGPARAGDRRPRRRLPGRQPLRRARPRPRLRLERDDGDLRQRRHLRRGPLQGQVPLRLQGQVPGDGKALQEGELDAEHDRHDRGRLADADRLPDRARDRLRPRQGRRQESRLRPRRAAPTSTRPTR